MKKALLKYCSLFVVIAISSLPASAENICPEQINEWAKHISTVFNKIQDDSCASPVVIECSNIKNDLYQIAAIKFGDSCADWENAGIHQLQLYLEKSDTINAVAKIDHDEDVSTGFITLSTSLMQTIKNEDQLAFVLAHEISHLKKNHVREEMSLLLLTPAQEEHMASIHKSWELEADMQAFLVITKAGYSHREAVNLLGTLAIYESGNIAGNHPSIKQRVLSLNRQANSAHYFSVLE